MAQETRVLTIADLNRLDAQEEAREARRKAVYADLLQIELPHEAA